MNENPDYLDTGKSVVISAPAGSGKTEKLARRYISLLEDGAGIEKILAITFTEKAAAEMKDRILNILLRDKPDLFTRFREKVPLMRITTIHAFCRKLITRFALELGLDPALGVLDEFGASRVWSESVYDTLRDEKDDPSLFFDYLRLKGIKGWGALYNTLKAIHQRRPYSEILLDLPEEGRTSEERCLLRLYGLCLGKYRERKAGMRVIDFNDMEVLAYRAMTSNPGWLNILYAFDEHTDHILVDEFQDTNSIQWRIIDRLTEEWRSGLGAKRSAGKTPTIFLVGDEKQSIYMFRGANVSIFHEVKNKFSEWLGREAVFLEAKDNYRSLPCIIDFSNRLFGRLMQGSLTDSWRTKYSPFTPVRQGNGAIELLVLDQEKNAKQTRVKEAGLIARKILSMAGNTRIYSAAGMTACRYSDIAVLLRSRTHLASFETALRECGIPYIVVGGIGFYDEPEVAALRELVCFLADPHDDFSLFALLRSPLFGFSESALFPFLSGRKGPLYENIRNAGSARFKKACGLLATYLSRINSMPLACLLEAFLTETGGWGIFRETQRHANIKKFLRVLEYYDADALSLYEIKENLIRSKKSSESKATVNTESLNAVRLMTVHGAKGLQFPVVFLPSLDEADTFKSGAVFLDEVDGAIKFSYEEDSSGRGKNSFFLLRKEKEAEEEKRLFYVAVTRAMDRLIMSGALKKDDPGPQKIKGRLSFIEETFPGSVTGTDDFEDLFTTIRGPELASAFRPSGTRLDNDTKGFFEEPLYIEGIGASPAARTWVTVTEDAGIRSRHGRDWVDLGILFHRLFEEISKGITPYQDLSRRVDALLETDLAMKNGMDRHRKIILKDLQKLEASGLLQEIILPSERSFAELPFVLQKEDRTYKGRIDRVILRDDTAFIYDYKTFPVNDRDIAELTEKYRSQMDIYSEACRDLFSVKTKSFILFTHKPALVEVRTLFPG